MHWRKEKGASSQKLKEEKKILSIVAGKKKNVDTNKTKKNQSEQVKMRKTNISKDGNTTDRCKTGYLTQKTKRKQK